LSISAPFAWATDDPEEDDDDKREAKIGTITLVDGEDGGPTINIGGAVRFNFVSENYQVYPGGTDGPDQLDTYWTWDTWRLNVDATISDVDLSFEYRFYPVFSTHFIHHGYIGYQFTDELYMKMGAFQKPFGISKFASHSWWFQIPYYVGLEDDYDMGIGLDYSTDQFEVQLAYFRQSEPEGVYGGFSTFGNSGPARYSYDVNPDGSGTYSGVYNETTESLELKPANVRELNTVNARFAYHINPNWEVGVSGQAGGMFNSELEESETATAFAGHLVGNFGNFNLKTEYINYNYSAKANDGSNLDVLQMGAYGFPYPVATEGNIYVAGLSHSFDVDWGPISNITAYFDYSMIDKSVEAFADTHHMVPGFLVTAGGIYAYFDYAIGQNQPWLSNPFGVGLGQGVNDADWNTRFNINLGYYF
jgi:hypothetical protein